MNILLLEDYRAPRYALTQVLEDDQHTAFSAASIKEATMLIETKRFDLLLLDLMIGNDLSTQIADLAGHRFPSAEIIYLTGSNQFPNGELFELSRNASWVFRKPVDFFEFKAMITHFKGSLLNKRDASASPVAILEA